MMESEVLLAALDEFVARTKQREFKDGTIAGLLIQEYWPTDIRPRGSEQQLSFYRSEFSAFDTVHSFASAVFLFSWEDDLSPSARSEFDVSDRLREIDTSVFMNEWGLQAAKVTLPFELTAEMVNAAWSLTDDWNDKLFVASGGTDWFAVSWSTSA